jgi:hypothetical protein
LAPRGPPVLYLLTILAFHEPAKTAPQIKKSIALVNIENSAEAVKMPRRPHKTGGLV